MNLNDEEKFTLRAINCLTASLFTVNLAFLLHNAVRYIYRLKIYRPLIIIFYILIFISTCSRITECILRIIEPQYSFFG